MLQAIAHSCLLQLDVAALQNILENITFCDIEGEGANLHVSGGTDGADLEIDANFVKLFQLAQLTIEYLLHSQV